MVGGLALLTSPLRIGALPACDYDAIFYSDSSWSTQVGKRNNDCIGQPHNWSQESASYQYNGYGTCQPGGAGTCIDGTYWCSNGVVVNSDVSQYPVGGSCTVPPV